MKALGLLRKHWLQFAILAAPLILIAIAWDKFPDRVAIHWNLRGRPNGWAGKTVGLLLCPLINICIALLLAWVPRLDPKLRLNPSAPERISDVVGILRLATTALLSFVSIMIAAAALGYSFNVTRVTIDASLVLLIILGNFFGTLRPNYFIGIRNPWTLENPEVWRATHRIGGRIFVFGSLALLALQFALTPAQLSTGFLIFVGATVAWSLLYSYRLSRSLAAHSS